MIMDVAVDLKGEPAALRDEARSSRVSDLVGLQRQGGV